MSRIRKIAVVTSTRADYGLLYWLLREIESDAELELQLVVTGTHLAPQFGITIDAILADGFAVAARVDMMVAGDGSVAAAKSSALALMGLAEAFERLAPDLVVVLGDRYEIMAAAQAAMLLRLPLAHIHGGELTEGAIDDAIRHSITKMAHLHFPAAPAYARRIVQLGEDPERVFPFGQPGLDHLIDMQFMSRAELAESLELDLGEPMFLVTYHPASLDANPATAAAALIAALERFENATVLITGVNADPGYAAVNTLLSQFAAQHPNRVKLFTSLGQRRYLSAARLASAVVGNSSSGLLEVPALGTPTVNCGDRQRGRLRPASVVDCAEHADSIEAAIRTVLDPGFRSRIVPYCPDSREHSVSRRIKNVLKSCSLDGLLKKRFVDIEGTRAGGF